MYSGNVTDKYKKKPEKSIASPNDVRREGTTDLIDIAEGIGNLSDAEEKFKSAIEFLRGKKHNVLYRDYIRQVGKKLITDDYYTGKFQKLAKNIHEHLDERLEEGKKGLSGQMTEDYTKKLGALVTQAFNRSQKGDISDPYMRMINYQHVEQLLKNTPMQTQDGKQTNLWNVVSDQIKSGDVQGAYNMLTRQMSAGLEASLESTIESKLGLDDYDFRKKAGELLAEKADYYLEGVDKFSAKGFFEERANELVKIYAEGGIESVVAALEKEGKIESKKQAKKTLHFKSGAADDYEYRETGTG